ncbi:MAG TPA: hypothetical protein PKA74_04455 [Bauldia sp.]|nr:hypothetical protein [Bauldia sp.]
MGVVLEFRARVQSADDEADIDLVTAVDAAIRDLRDISRRWGEADARQQAEECREMLERALAAAV